MDKFSPADQYTKEGEFIQTWDSIKAASVGTGVLAIGISNVCRGFRKSSGGFIWKYNQPDKVKKKGDRYGSWPGFRRHVCHT